MERIRCSIPERKQPNRTDLNQIAFRLRKRGRVRQVFLQPFAQSIDTRFRHQYVVHAFYHEDVNRFSEYFKNHLANQSGLDRKSTAQSDPWIGNGTSNWNMLRLFMHGHIDLQKEEY